MIRITNKNGLPEPICRAVEAQMNGHDIGDADISVTQLIDSPLINWLYRFHKNDPRLLSDAQDGLWALYGVLLNQVLDQFASEGKGEFIQISLKSEFNGLWIAGHPDLLLLPGGLLQDYKFTSAYKVKNAKEKGVPPVWEAQLNLYMWLIYQRPDILKSREIEKLQIVACLRDYGPRFSDLKPVEILDVPRWSAERVRDYLRERTDLHKAALQMDEFPPICSEEERWNRNQRCKNYCIFGSSQTNLCPYLEVL